MKNEEKLKKLGSNIAVLRKKHKMSQGVLSEKLGVSREHLAKIETAKKGMSMGLFFRIADILEVKESELFNFD